MKIILVFLCIIYSLSSTDIFVPMYISNNGNLITMNDKSAVIVQNLKDYKEEKDFYIKFNSENGTINPSISYNFTENCPKSEDTTLNINDYDFNHKEPSNSVMDDKKRTFYLEYQLTKPAGHENKDFCIIVLYDGFEGGELTVSISPISNILVLIILLCAGGVILIIIITCICCCCCNCCCRQRRDIIIKEVNSTSYAGPSAPLMNSTN